jgi:hypothetical protein
LACFGSGTLLKVPGRLRPLRICSADGGEELAAAFIDRAVEHCRPEGSHLQHIMTVEGDVADPAVPAALRRPAHLTGIRDA